MKILYKISCFIFLLSSSSCRKFIDIDPPQNQLVSVSVFNTVESAEAAVTGIYSQMMQSASVNTFPVGYNTVLGGLSSDELLYAPTGNNISPEYAEIAANNIQPKNLEIQNFWDQAYRYINNANAIIEGLNNSQGIDAANKARLSGEAYFIRAWCHYNLLSFFGGVPYITSADYRQNINAGRLTENDDMDNIIADLKIAENQLGATPDLESRTRPGNSAVKSLLAKVYLLKKDWLNAESYSSELINSGEFLLADEPTSVFNKDSKEIIWQLEPIVPPNFVVEEAAWFIPADGSYPVATITDQLRNAFEANDLRSKQWLDSVDISGTVYYFPFKYRLGYQFNDEQSFVVFRLAEQYLIRAEARLHNSNTEGAIQDINMIRSRAGLQDLQSNDLDVITNAILKERQVELFAEWGNRWVDLKRSGKIDEVMSSVKGNNWQATDQLYPIPQSELLADHNLQQNSGY